MRKNRLISQLILSLSHLLISFSLFNKRWIIASNHQWRRAKPLIDGGFLYKKIKHSGRKIKKLLSLNALFFGLNVLYIQTILLLTRRIRDENMVWSFGLCTLKLKEFHQEAHQEVQKLIVIMNLKVALHYSSFHLFSISKLSINDVSLSFNHPLVLSFFN